MNGKPYQAKRITNKMLKLQNLYFKVKSNLLQAMPQSLYQIQLNNQQDQKMF